MASRQIHGRDEPWFPERWAWSYTSRHLSRSRTARASVCFPHAQRSLSRGRPAPARAPPWAGLVGLAIRVLGGHCADKDV